jgi:hypothetical protein
MAGEGESEMQLDHVRVRNGENEAKADAASSINIYPAFVLSRGGN